MERTMELRVSVKRVAGPKYLEKTLQQRFVERDENGRVIRSEWRDIPEFYVN